MRIYGLSADTEVSEEKYYSKTYAMNNNRIEGYVDNRAALEQAIYKILQTEQYAYPVYSFAYGVQLCKLPGREAPYVHSELKRMIREVLLRDNRINEVSGFEFEFKEDNCNCSFLVESIYGTIAAGMEVGMYV